jgi:hypothetical protein
VKHIGPSGPEKEIKMTYDQWPAKNPWRIEGSYVRSELGEDDTVSFALDDPTTPTKIFLQTVDCAASLGHSPRHAGADWRGQQCSPDPTDLKKVSGTTLGGISFVIEHSTDASGKNVLICTYRNGNAPTWTAIEGGNGFDYPGSGEAGSRHEK